MYKAHASKHQKWVYYVTGAVFILAMLTLLTYGIWGENHMNPERLFRLNSYEYLQDDWTITYEDGSTDTISLPAQNVLKLGQSVVLSHVVPVDSRYDTVMLWNYGQDIEIYVNGTRRFTYNAKNIHSVGSDRPFLLVQMPLQASDYGKTIEIHYSAPVVSSGHTIGSVIVGSQIATLMAVIRLVQLELVIGIFLLMVGVIVTLASFFLQFSTGHNIPLKFLGTGVILASAWLLLNSIGRQFLLPNVSVARNCAFLVVALMPIPFAFFFDDLMENRRHVFFQCVQHLCLFNFFLVFTLLITEKNGPSELQMLNMISACIFIIGVICYTIDDFKHGYGKKYRFSAIGAIVFGICSIIQIVIYRFSLSERVSGLFLGAGLFFMAALSTIETILELGELRNSEKQAKAQVETLSMEALLTISKTVDAKDPYTSEHSKRVSEYGVLLAQRLGWEASRVEKLRDAALLHDIGKIGIPDSILNKNGKLTDEEFFIIKSHTTMGAEILQNISSLEYAVDVARHHHEKYNGTGYPDGLSGEDIPEVARLVCIVDSYDAMHSKRVYRGAMDDTTIREELVKCRGTQFDPVMLDAFLTLFDDGSLSQVQ